MSLVERDGRHLWHPYTQHGLESEPLPVRAASGALLELEDGRTLIDAISSWWTCLHGHGHPRLVAAIAEQAATLDHVLFAGATHAPAVELAEGLVECAPPGLTRVFYSDDGSTSVEVALKMVYQRWMQAGEDQRRVFLAFEGSYHGDTFGAMAVGDPDPFFLPFGPFLFEVQRVAPDAERVAAALEDLGQRAAGVILEPLVQGAGGMRMHGTELLVAIRKLCDRHGLPFVADEVMTGFGRTGALFACGKAGISPDILCLSKGISGGMLPLAATLTTESIYESFLSDDRGRAFFHGHSYTANPIGCAVGVASLRLCREEDVPGRLDRIGRSIEGGLAERLSERGRPLDLRRTGGIVALDLPPPSGERAGYLSTLAGRLRAESARRGVLLRPLGNVLYAMPPACTSEEQCDAIVDTMVHLVGEYGDQTRSAAHR